MIDALAATAESPRPVSSAQNRASLSREQFLRILVAELTTQDPLEPLNNSDFMQQLVGMQGLEQTAALTDSLKTFERFIQMSSGSGMIGKTVKGMTAAGQAVQGVVSRVVLEGNVVSVVVGSQKLPITSVTEIKAE